MNARSILAGCWSIALLLVTNAMLSVRTTMLIAANGQKLESVLRTQNIWTSIVQRYFHILVTVLLEWSGSSEKNNLSKIEKQGAVNEPSACWLRPPCFSIFERLFFS